MKKQLFILTKLIVVASTILVACGGGAAATEEVPAVTQPPAPTEAPATTEPPQTTEAQQYREIMKTKGLDNDDKINSSINPSKDCIYTEQGQAAIVTKGAAAIVVKGADGSPITLPAPHGVITFEELHSVINRAIDPNTNQLANTEIQQQTGYVAPQGSVAILVMDDFEDELVQPNTSSEFGLNWIKSVVYFDNVASQKSIILVGIDTSDYATDIITSHLTDAINVLSPMGYSLFVINMSFVVMPCPSIANPQATFATFDQYRNWLQSEDPQLAHLKDYLSITEDGDQNISLNDNNGNVILKRLAAPVNNNNFTDRDGNIINDQDAGLILAFNPSLGPLRLVFNSPVNIPDYNPSAPNKGVFQKYFAQVLTDPIRKTLKDPGYLIIPIAAAGNDGLPYPYAPAMWNEVLSVGAPIDEKDEQGLQLSTFVDEAGNKLPFKSNSGEVVAEGCTEYKDIDGNLHRIPGTSFASPKVSYLAALYLLQGGTVSCTGNLGVSPVPPLGYADEDGNWHNMPVPDAASEYCSVFPASVDPGISCP